MRTVAAIALALGLVFGGSGGMWICIADGAVGLFSHAHSHGGGCGPHPETADAGDTGQPAFGASDCCADVLVGGWLVSYKEQAGTPKVSAIVAAAPLAILPRVAGEPAAPRHTLSWQSRAPPGGGGSYFLPLSTLVLRL